MTIGKNFWTRSSKHGLWLAAVSILFSMACNSDLSITADGYKKPLISGFDRLAASPGEEVLVTGKHLSKDMTLLVNDEAVDVNFIDSNSVSFILPASIPVGVVEVNFMKGRKTIAKYPIMNSQALASLPISPVPVDNVCDNYIIKNQDGSLARGLARCGEELPPCTEDGQSRCIATDQFKVAYTSDLAAKVVTGSTVAGVSGTARPRPVECSADGSTDCVAMPAFPAADASAFTSSDIRSGISIAGTLGILSGAPIGCASDGETACIANASFPAVDKLVKLDAGNIKSGVSIAGITGDYPSPANPLAGATGTADLPPFASTTGGSTYEWFDSAGARVTGTIEANATTASSTSNTVLNAGLYRQLTVTGDADLVAVNISSGINILGVAGSAILTPSNCSTDGQTACVAVANFPAIDKDTKLLAGNIRNGVVIGPTTGNYPSATSPLVSDTATADLIDPTLASQIKTATAFEYWDATGTRHSGAGDADIAATNILSSASIFGQAGSIPTNCAHSTQFACTADNACRWTGLACEIDPWNIRVGSTIAGKSGTLKTSCRNKASGGQWDMEIPYDAIVTANSPTIAVPAHPFSNGTAVRLGASTPPTGITRDNVTYYVVNAAAGTIEISATPGGAAITPTDAGANVSVFRWGDGTYHWWDTNDDYNGNAAYSTTLVSGWSSSTDCGSSEWQDLTADGTCDAAADDCIMKDRISGQMWSESYPVTGAAAGSAGLYWQDAVQWCDGLTFGAYSDWRLPTQKELMEASIHGIRDVGWNGAGVSTGSTNINPNFIANVEGAFYSASTLSHTASRAWYVDLHMGLTTNVTKATAYQVIYTR